MDQFKDELEILLKHINVECYHKWYEKCINTNLLIVKENQIYTVKNYDEAKARVIKSVYCNVVRRNDYDNIVKHCSRKFNTNLKYINFDEISDEINKDNVNVYYILMCRLFTIFSNVDIKIALK